VQVLGQYQLPLKDKMLVKALLWEPLVVLLPQVLLVV
jgi:hypothetical protein